MFSLNSIHVPLKQIAICKLILNIAFTWSLYFLTVFISTKEHMVRVKKL